MKLAFFGDIHGNLPALEAVLADAHARRVDALYCTGDLVGYGPHPEQVVRRIRELDIPAVAGNYDRKVLTVRKRTESWRKKRHPLKLLAFEWAYDHLSRSSREALASLPDSLRVGLSPPSIRVQHDCRLPAHGPLGPDTSQSDLLELAANLEEDCLVFGHTHRPFQLRAGGKLFLNAGSVGRAEGDPRACYALLSTDEFPSGVEFVQVAYDVERTVADLRQAGLPPAFATMLRTGQPLLEVLAREEDPGDDQALRLHRIVRFVEELLPSDASHARQVARLSGQLFDATRERHGLPDTDRFLLLCAAWLHDTGWSRSLVGHHKQSLHLILEEERLPLSPAERLLVGNIARYHNKALPSSEHPHFAALGPADRERVRWLAAFVRVADGLDSQHLGLVERVACRWRPEMALDCRLRLPPGQAGAPRAGREWQRAQKKSDLLGHLLGGPVRINMGPTIPMTLDN